MKRLLGKTREQIDVDLATKTRAELLDIIYSLLAVEPLLKPSDIAARSCINKRAVLGRATENKCLRVSGWFSSVVDADLLRSCAVAPRLIERRFPSAKQIAVCSQALPFRSAVYRVQWFGAATRR